MKKLIMLAVMIQSVMVQAQKYTASEAENSEFLLLSKENTITLTGISQANQNNYSVMDESNAILSAKKNYNKNSKILSFDLSELINEKKIKGSAFLKLPNEVKKELRINEGEGGKLNNNNTAGSRNEAFGYTGIAVWDAKAILNLWKKIPASESKNKILDWIRTYSGGDKKDWADILKNPFFALSDTLKKIAQEKRAQPHAALPDVTGILGNLSGLNVTKYVQAFADFLRDRIKEELTFAYLQKLRKAIDSSEELQYMLPQTRNVFLKNDVFNIPSMGAMYKAAFAQDLESLMPNFEKLVYSSAKKEYQTLRKSEGFIGFMIAYHFADLSAKNYHPADILLKLDKSYGFEVTPGSKISYVVSVADIFSQHLLDTSGSKWIGRNELKNFSKDEIYIFLGLLYEKYPMLFDAPLDAANTKSLKSILLVITSGVIIDKVYEWLTIINTMDERIKAFKQTTNNATTVLGYFADNADALMEVIDYIIQLTGIENIYSQQYNKWKNVLQSSLQAAKGIRENDLGKVGSNVLFVVNELVVGEQNWKKDLAEFIELLTDVVNAKTSEDIKDLLERRAAPIRSYRVARSYYSSIAVTSYPGLYGGIEFNGKANTTEGSFGITAPIGLSFNWRNKKEGSNSIYISLLDIGAALSYRFNNDTADLPQKIFLGQIFSPGLFGIHGFKNSPLALRYGFQYAPLLRTIKNGNNIYRDAGVWRISIGLDVDIPVFILSRRKER